MSDLVPDGWSFKSINDVATIFAGGTPSRGKPEYYNGNIPWVKSGEVNARQVFNTSEHISLLALPSFLSKPKLEEQYNIVLEKKIY